MYKTETCAINRMPLSPQPITHLPACRQIVGRVIFGVESVLFEFLNQVRREIVGDQVSDGFLCILELLASLG